MGPMDRRERSGFRQPLALILLILSCVGLLALPFAASRLLRIMMHPAAPSASTVAPRGPQPTPPIARRFEWPLQPQDSYGPYVQGLNGSRAIDTSFGAQNPALGNRSNCFQDRGGNPVPFSQLYHAGVDLFSLDRTGVFLWGSAARNPVRAVADGVVVSALDAGTEGQILMTEHSLEDQTTVYAVYWHVDQLRVASGQPVECGQIIALVHDQGLNSHLHWEMRTFPDGSQLFPSGTAGARGTCNGHAAGVAYTWDDVQEKARPEFYGYLDPLLFVASPH